ncbi:hypothetical protein Zmor_007043 [Zophobas morio]|uniref:Uncharacterized protein n=1 Tax=Zophobas morio TaxID=2755281 RepID=A0AA38MPA8_9CUCU|nr:hypothetical protein Zmor_007043 [Zophobas morio]
MKVPEILKISVLSMNFRCVSWALETLLCLAPLNLYIEEAAMRTSLRLHSLGVWNKQGRTTKHTRILTEAFNRIPLLRMGCDRMGTMNDNSEGRAEIDIYVDGAKTDSGSVVHLLRTTERTNQCTSRHPHDCLTNRTDGNNAGS